MRESDQVSLRLGPELLAKFPQRTSAAVTDRRTKVLQHVVDDGAHGSSCRHADLEPLRSKRLQLSRIGLLQIEPIANGTDRGHPAKYLERDARDFLRLRHDDRFQYDLAGSFLGAGKGA